MLNYDTLHLHYEGYYTIQWLADIELELVINYYEDDDYAECENEFFKNGRIDEVDIIDDDGGTVNMQFGDGSICFGVPKTLFSVT